MFIFFQNVFLQSKEQLLYAIAEVFCEKIFLDKYFFIAKRKKIGNFQSRFLVFLIHSIIFKICLSKLRIYKNFKNSEVGYGFDSCWKIWGGKIYIHTHYLYIHTYVYTYIRIYLYMWQFPTHIPHSSSSSVHVCNNGHLWSWAD